MPLLVSVSLVEEFIEGPDIVFEDHGLTIRHPYE